MTKLVESVKIGANPRCGYCIDWANNLLPTCSGSMGVCDNTHSDHYGHIVYRGHPACKHYCKRRLLEE